MWPAFGLARDCPGKLALFGWRQVDSGKYPPLFANSTPPLIAKEPPVPDPQQHSKDRNFIETIGRYVPGFRGYLEKEYRRQSDQLARTWLADQLQQGKQGIDDYGRSLLDAGQLDRLDEIDRLRARLDRAVSRLQGQMGGYSGFFDYVRIDEEDLDDVYQHDMQLMQQVKQLADRLAGLPSESGSSAEVVRETLSAVDAVQREIDKREEILAGLN